MSEQGAVLRLREVIEMTGLSRSSIYSMMAKGEFPKNFSLGVRARGWLASEIVSWIRARAGSRNVLNNAEK